MEKLTVRVVSEYQARKGKCQTIGEFKELGRELRDRFGLTDRDAIDLLNSRNELMILRKYQEE